MPEIGTLRPARPRPAVRATPAAAIVASVVLVELSSGITQGFLSPLLASLTSVLHVTAADLNWVSIASLLASVAFTPVLSRMGDLYGHRKVLRWNLAIVLLGSVLVGLSRSFGLLLAGSLLQGAFAGFFPLLVGILRNRSDRAESRRGISFMVAALTSGVAVGLVASGLLAKYSASPTAALWVPTAAVALALAVTWPLLPETEYRPGGRVDWAGGLLLCVGLVAIMLGLGQGGAPGWEWTSARTLGCLLGGAAVTAVWAVVELRTAEPMIDVRLFRHRNVVVVSLVALTFTFGMLGLLVANPVFLGTSKAQAGYGLGLDPLGISLAMLPNMLALTLGALIAPAVASRITDRLVLVTGSLLMAVGFVAEFAGHSSLVAFLAATAVAGLGSGLLQHATRTLAVEAVPPEQTSVGSGINELLINVGGSIGAAVVLAVFAAQTPAGQVLPRLGAYTTSWLLCAAVAAAGAVLSLLHRGTKR
ncbi:MFS transporter [Streptacidiphilus jiangxiensis]|uniref:Major Facilitator Superfamily protein n=1 Tax=Streptacidiphilus jiangxiensis TaxID=235985 RepID=A0A1H7TUX8_STRJI|nr:MFS transporter [Streptacidiphilus jiangxiensis]SEL88304.1 Major Facilitator Superfamily protein [Streptacidiphilus jiangxiensis]